MGGGTYGGTFRPVGHVATQLPRPRGKVRHWRQAEARLPTTGTLPRLVPRAVIGGGSRPGAIDGRGGDVERWGGIDSPCDGGESLPHSVRTPIVCARSRASRRIIRSPRSARSSSTERVNRLNCVVSGLSCHARRNRCTTATGSRR